MMDCKACSSRREFLQLAALGLGALPVAFADGFAQGEERRYPFPSVDGVTIDRTQQVIIVRAEGLVYAFNLSCPHENTALKWLPKDRRFQCPKHGSRYQPNGTFITGRATRNMDRLKVRREGNDLFADLSHIIKSDASPAEWAAAAIHA